MSEVAVTCVPAHLALRIAGVPATCGDRYWLRPEDAITAQAPGYAVFTSTLAQARRAAASGSAEPMVEGTLVVRSVPERTWECRIGASAVDVQVFEACGVPGSWTQSRTFHVRVSSTKSTLNGTPEIRIRSKDEARFAVAIEPASDGCFGRAVPEKPSEKDSMDLGEDCRDEGANAWRVSLIICETASKPGATLQSAAVVQIYEPGSKEVRDVFCES